MSELKVTSIRGRSPGTSPSLPSGVVVTGVTTSGSLDVNDTTQSTSTTTGSVVISGGVGIGKSLHVGGNVSIGGTLTYEDVQNIDSVGLITARSGINIVSGGIKRLFGGTVTYTVKVAAKTAAHRYNGSGSPNGYVIDEVESPYITLTPGRTYKFDQADSTNGTHQIKFYQNADKTGLYEGGVTYNGTAGQAGAYTQIVVNDYTPTVLFYQCINHAYMGNAVNTNSNSSMTAQSGSVTAMAANSIDCRVGNYFTKTISGATTFTFDNVPSTGVIYGFTLELTHTGGSGSITWPTSVKWPLDTPPTLTDGKTSLLMFVTDDGGTRWRGSSLADYTT